MTRRVPKFGKAILASQAEQVCHNLVERKAGIDLVGGDFSWHPWFDGSDEPQNACHFLGALSVVVGRPGGQSLDDQVWRCGKQDDVIELRVEFRHILGAAADEQDAGVAFGQQVLDAGPR